MTSISIIGTGNMANTIGVRAAEYGHTVELLGRDAAKAQVLADRIGNGVVVGTYGATPQGDIVIIAVPHQNAVDVVKHYGDALAAKVLVDITNPFNADGSGLVTAARGSISDQISAVAPAGAHVVKALNTVFGQVLGRGTSLDAFLAGDDTAAKARVAAFLESLGMQPRDAGGLEMAHALEWAALLLVGVARNGAGFDSALALKHR